MNLKEICHIYDRTLWCRLIHVVHSTLSDKFVVIFGVSNVSNNVKVHNALACYIRIKI